MVELLGFPHSAMGDKRHTRSTTSEISPSSGVDTTKLLTQLNRLTISSNPFRNVPLSSYLLLLTPYLHVCSNGIPSTPGTDPFEPLGRKLTHFHSNIRHVPYVAGHGLIEIHKYLIAYAGGIILVVWKPLSSKVDDDERLDDEADQVTFTEEASVLIEKADIPCLLVTVGLPYGNRIHFTGDHLEVDDWSELASAAERVYQM
jgi:hypothetical protein